MLEVIDTLGVLVTLGVVLGVTLWVTLGVISGEQHGAPPYIGS